MYFAIDEAGTHVGSETFRLIAAVHDETGTKLLGTACSQPIRQGHRTDKEIEKKRKGYNRTEQKRKDKATNPHAAAIAVITGKLLAK